LLAAQIATAGADGPRKAVERHGASELRRLCVSV
jgi:hypothetical protein